MVTKSRSRNTVEFLYNGPSFVNYSLISINMTGTIKTLIAEKHFGFITPEGDSKDIFFHESALNGVNFTDLKAGDAVNFDTEDSEKGPRAINVTLA